MISVVFARVVPSSSLARRRRGFTAASESLCHTRWIGVLPRLCGMGGRVPALRAVMGRGVIARARVGMVNRLSGGHYMTTEWSIYDRQRIFVNPGARVVPGTVGVFEAE